MTISEWFRARDERRYTPTTPVGDRPDVPDGVWVKCESCKHIVYQGELDNNAQVCKYCGFHFEMPARERLQLLVDEGTLDEIDTAMTSADPLGFVAAKTYEESLQAARAKSELPEAIVTARAAIDEHRCAVGAMDFRFIGASMGSVVGEKVTRLFEMAIAEERSVVLWTTSGGARMQEGMLSLMQMAKTAAAVERLASAGLPYVSILGNPTLGGVTASFATLADVILAEPGALVGFAGPRVIEQTIRQRVPKGFQSAEFLLEHGMVDLVVPRAEIRDTVTLLLGYLAADPGDGRA